MLIIIFCSTSNSTFFVLFFQRYEFHNQLNDLLENHFLKCPIVLNFTEIKYIFRSIYNEYEAYLGEQSKNGTWSGVVGKVQNGTVNICGQILLLQQRMDVINQLRPLVTDRYDTFQPKI